ncbi:Flp pilus assembly protein CpaB [Idiomarina aquatica]|uniref:Flp pilus assembly protein CpaB n=1 Tax=Idiomarina aquatica TaxID=1327752 RepID=A0A4R6PN01_9GAMM|nr:MULTISPECIES: Flp pilus assembly protein CpaB [Idiomarina]MBL4742711.1 Flp pilus assembly protein CpaB [Idiomarina sp.]PHQ74780.1 MAG: Flp pilus assembly protein CpaB [Idiomarina sp.]TDP39073.1 Flp pilus assembly protein CpaB [Idiomarina aquatica]
MKTKFKWIIILVISLVMTAITLLFLQKYLSEETERRLAEAEPEGIKIVVFARALAADTTVSAEVLALREFPEHLISQQWLQQHQLAPFIGQSLRYAVDAGEPLTQAMLINTQFNGLSRQLPEGFYAVTLTASEVTLHNGLLAVGDSVDVIFKETTMSGEAKQHSFSAVEVFSLGGNGGSGNYAANNITLLIPASDIADFTRYQKDEYALWVRPSEMAEDTEHWRPTLPASRILQWQGGQ